MRRFTDDNGDTVVELKRGITVTRSFANPATFKVELSIVSKAQSAKRKNAPDPILAIEPERELSESHVGILREIRPYEGKTSVRYAGFVSRAAGTHRDSSHSVTCEDL